MSNSEPSEGSETPTTSRAMSLDGTWLVATDPANAGREQEWWNGPRQDARETAVPWIVEDAFPDYEGVAWYWRCFVAPENPHADGRALLRSWAVHYKADVWVNGTYIGEHEGGEGPFTLDATGSVRPNEETWVAVRVLNPGEERIDGMVRREVPHQQFREGGGIVDSVDLLLAPAVRVASLGVDPDADTRVIAVEVEVENSFADSVGARLDLRVAPARDGETVVVQRLCRDVPRGGSVVRADLRVADARLWDLKDPFLYRVSATLETSRSDSVDEYSVRCGFRDFRLTDGYFRLNGRRVFLRSALTTSQRGPIGGKVPYDQDMFRRMLMNAKTSGLNIVRYLSGMPRRDLLDLCDEIGLMIYQEPMGGWFMEDSPHMAERYDRGLQEMILRDRNHPCIVMWELQDEAHDNPTSRHARETLPLIRSLDQSRTVALSSGRWDRDLGTGSFSNPGSTTWDGYLGDEGPGQGQIDESDPRWLGHLHRYFQMPHATEDIRSLRTTGEGAARPVYHAEYGIGTCQDVPWLMRMLEQWGKTHLGNYGGLSEAHEEFERDWERWKLSETFARPEDYFAAGMRDNGRDCLIGLNAIRANPYLVGHSITALTDNPLSGNGLMDAFCELKPGVADAVRDGLTPLRWCLFAEPYSIYRNTPVRLEAVLANEDVLDPGDYRARAQVIGPDARLSLDRSITVTVPGPSESGEPPLATQVYGEDVVIDGPAGSYRFVVAFERDAAAAGGEAVFNVFDEMPSVDAEVVLWGEDAELAGWLAENGIRTRPFDPAGSDTDELLLAGSAPASPGGRSPI